MSAPRIPDKLIAALRVDRLKGMSYSELELKHKCNRSTIKKYCKGVGVPATLCKFTAEQVTEIRKQHNLRKMPTNALVKFCKSEWGISIARSTLKDILQQRTYKSEADKEAWPYLKHGADGLAVPAKSCLRLIRELRCFNQLQYHDISVLCGRASPYVRRIADHDEHPILSHEALFNRYQGWKENEMELAERKPLVWDRIREEIREGRNVVDIAESMFWEHGVVAEQVRRQRFIIRLGEGMSKPWEHFPELRMRHERLVREEMKIQDALGRKRIEEIKKHMLKGQDELQRAKDWTEDQCVLLTAVADFRHHVPSLDVQRATAYALRVRYRGTHRTDITKTLVKLAESLQHSGISTE